MNQQARITAAAAGILAITAQAVDYHGFMAESDQSYYAPEWQMFLVGLEERDLTTSGSTVTMGHNNRAFVLDYQKYDSTHWAYWHDLQGGSFSYTVDVSEVGCACAAGVFAVELNDSACSWNPKPEGQVPQCPRIDIMKANQDGFAASSHPCEFGTCDIQSQCKRHSSSAGAMAYGKGSDYKINTNEPYQVWTRFWTDQDQNGAATDLKNIQTVLSQAGQEVIIDQDCPDYLDALSAKLKNNVRIGISNFALPQNNDVGGTCAEACSQSNLVIKDLKWVSFDSLINEDDDNEPGEPTWGGPASELTAGECGEGCSECREFWYSNLPNEKSYQCFDSGLYRFGTGCGRRADKESCMTGDGLFCLKSWPHNDPQKGKSVNAKCRTVPSSHIIDPQELKFRKKQAKKPTWGQCLNGCPESSKCKFSFPKSDPLRGKSAYGMYRCTAPEE